MNFKSNLQNKEAKNIQLQNYIIEYVTENHSESFIKSNILSFENNRDVIQFILQVDHFCQVRPKFIDKFLNLTKIFLNEFKNKKIPADQIAPIIKTPQLLYLLYTESVIDIDTIISLCSNNRHNFFEIFSNEIEKFDSCAFDYFLNFEKKKPKEREIDSKINKLIQILKNDKIEDFIEFVSLSDININTFKISMNDININEKYFILEFFEDIQQLSLIEFSIMFGSELIFKYLIMNKISFQNFSLISQLAIMGNNFNIIHILEDFNIQYKLPALKIAIKCHYNDLIEYIISNNNIFQMISNFDILNECLINYNYSFLFSHDEIFIEFERIKKDQLLSLFQIAMKCKNSDFLECLTDSLFNKSNQNYYNLLKNKIKIELNNEIDSFQIIEFLYSNTDKFDIQKYNEYFTFACQNGFFSICDFLLKNEQKIDVNFKIDKNGKNNLFSAVEHCCYNIVNLLMKNSNVNVNDTENNYGVSL